ncbi:MAG: tRNA lysidine(34) synthetase TilS [Verrucomicrobiota bacterium]|nr:tRNA lysidine(34) synthetase TilS [Verrucomicrobiota bacterium]
MNPLVRRIEKTICDKNLFHEGQSILVAVSGGLDSMVLLSLLQKVSAKYQWKLNLAHFNHQLRGRSSDADEKFVGKIADKLKLPILVERAKVKQFARQNHLSIEMAARKLRHEFFVRAAKLFKTKTIVLAHHADDRVELFFLRLLRGSGGEGLSGMKWISKSPEDKRISLVRPLLDISKRDLEKYAEENTIPFREDASNARLDFQRNRVRHELIPILQKIHSGAIQTILRSMEIIGAETEFVAQIGRDWLGQKNQTDFEKLSVAMQRRILQMQLLKLKFSPTFDLIEQLRTAPNRVVTLASETLIRRDAKGKLRLQQNKIVQFNQASRKIQLSPAGNIIFAGLKISWRLQKAPAISFKLNEEFFDVAKVGPEIILRHWRPGDRFQPIGMKATPKLHDLFINLKIPKAERRQRVVATTPSGEIFWVEGLRMAERFKLDSRTVGQLQWKWNSVKNGCANS